VAEPSPPVTPADSKAHYFEIAAFPLTGETVYRTLVRKYILIAVYSAGAAVVGLPAITEVAGAVYGFIFPIALFATSIMALIGVVRSRHTGHTRLEYWGTAFMIAGMVGYAVALFYRAAIGLAPIGTMPSALLPVILSMYPGARVLNILKETRPARPPKQNEA
jgi:hypothetical protein